MSFKKVAVEVAGIILIVIGLGIFCFGEVLIYECQQRIIDTDVESIVNGEVPLHRTVRVSGKLEESYIMIYEKTIYEKRDEKITKFFHIYDLSDEKDNKVLIKSDDPIGKIGETVRVTGTLRYREYGYYDYLIDVEAEITSIRWFFVCIMLFFALCGIILLSVAYGIE